MEVEAVNNYDQTETGNMQEAVSENFDTINDTDLENASGESASNDNGINESVDDDQGQAEDKKAFNAASASRRRAMESRIQRERARARAEAQAELLDAMRKIKSPAQEQTVKPSGANNVSGVSAYGNRTTLSGGGDIDYRINSAIESHPAVIAARNAAAELEAENKRRADEKRAEAFGTEIKKISEMDPDIKSVEDLEALPEYDIILDLVARGYEPSDAYRSVYFDKIVSLAAERGKRQERAASASKSHLVPDKHRGSGGGSGVTVPKDIEKMYRDMIPGMSAAEISRHYEKYIKQNK